MMMMMMHNPKPLVIVSGSHWIAGWDTGSLDMNEEDYFLLGVGPQLLACRQWLCRLYLHLESLKIGEWDGSGIQQNGKIRHVSVRASVKGRDEFGDLGVVYRWWR
jgi:hypothetical protein